MPSRFWQIAEMGPPDDEDDDVLASTELDGQASQSRRATRSELGPADAVVGVVPAATGIDAFTELRWITVQTKDRHYPYSTNTESPWH